MILTKLNTHFQRFNFANILSSFKNFYLKKLDRWKLSNHIKLQNFEYVRKISKILNFEIGDKISSDPQYTRLNSFHRVGFLSQIWFIPIAVSLLLADLGNRERKEIDRIEWIVSRKKINVVNRAWNSFHGGHLRLHTANLTYMNT